MWEIELALVWSKHSFLWWGKIHLSSDTSLLSSLINGAWRLCVSTFMTALSPVVEFYFAASWWNEGYQDSNFMWNTFINTLVCRGRVEHIVESGIGGRRERGKGRKWREHFLHRKRIFWHIAQTPNCELFSTQNCVFWVSTHDNAKK